ncbi:hypothetical protein ACFFMN_33985 [Planobispora siamensis]|uniref:Phage XkdN-like tail assembly chaperone protein, TAC n=1 Tax=Planobispora siamensis TaxID=936338 RepID=A0A8J3SF57_9ACTN|nr:hypothetical protein [Planobispora siamensis]GIH91935.1 hypothetical protein Psi01_25650 [Planobispora siamensis]
MNLISKDELWQVAADLPWEDVMLRRPPNGDVIGVMRLRGLTGAEVNEWQEQATEGNGKRRKQSKHAMALLVVKSTINEDGSQFFDAKDVLKVSQMPSYVLLQLTEVAMTLSGLGDDDEAKELIEGFVEGPSEGSTSD